MKEFKNWFLKNIDIKLLSLFLAIILWLYIASGENPIVENFIDVSLHVHSSPPGSLASAHVSASTPNCVLQENQNVTMNRAQWVVDMFRGGDVSITDGYMALPDKPGLGCDLDEKIAAKIPYKPLSISRLKYEDGSVSDH